MYKRIQGFFTEFTLCLNEVAAFVLLILPLKGDFRLVFDRTNWQFGKSDINYFVLAICYRNVSIPIFWINLEKRGCSSDAERIALLNKFKDKFEKEHGVKMGFMSFFVKAAVAALKKYPVLNASIDGNDVVYHGYFDIGIAVGSPRGLVVPILRNVDQMSIADIEKKIGEFGQKAKDGKLTLDDLTGGTFSISNGGVFGSMLSTPIINPPQSAILGVHATKDRAVVENGQIVIRPMNYLAMSYDHRLIDGREAVLGLVAMKETLEDPARLLLDL